MIKPVNGHILIEPVKHESFVASQKETYEEVGVVVDDVNFELRKGDKVFFDSYLAAKYPTGEGDEYFWLVKWEDVRAIEHAETIPK